MHANNPETNAATNPIPMGRAASAVKTNSPPSISFAIFPKINGTTIKKENFADKWESNPKRAEEMFRWIESANKEFESYQNETNIDVITESLEKSFRLDNATAITGKAKKREGLAVAAKAVEVKTDPWSHSGDSY